MPSDAPSASWHPAFMPNSSADLHQKPTAEPLPSIDNHDSAAEPRADLFSADDAREDADNKSVSANEWFPDNGASDNWIDDSTDNAQAPAESVSQDEHREGSQNEMEDYPDDIPHNTGRMSFARTAHEVNWNDDDEPESTLPRAGTDLFKFMPPNDRTNSFPPVPQPKQGEGNAEPEEPLPTNQPEEDSNQLAQAEESNEQGSFDFGPIVDGDRFLDDLASEENVSHPVMGGDLNEATEDPSLTRYTEEVPLISPGQDGLVEEDTTKEEKDLFGEGNPAEEDDFFTQVRDDGNEEAPLAAETAEDDDFFTQLRDDGNEQTSTAEEPVENQAVSAPEAAKQADADDVPAPAEVPEVDWTGLDLDDEKVDWTGLDLDDEILEDSIDEKPVAEENDPPITPTAPAAPSQKYLPAGQPQIPSPRATQPYLPSAVTPAPMPAQDFYAPAAPAIPTYTPFGPSSPAPPAPIGHGSSALQSTNKPQPKGLGEYPEGFFKTKPRKSASVADLQKTTSGTPPPRSASLTSPPQPPPAASPNVPPRATVSQTAHSLPGTQKPAPATETKFFADLKELGLETRVPKRRPGSSQSNKGLPSPHPAPLPQFMPPPAAQQPPVPHQPQIPPASIRPVGDIPQLVSPPPVNPYASLPLSTPTLAPAVPPATVNRYSPAPPNALPTNGSISPPAQSRYSPAPPARQASSSYAPSPIASAPPILPHQPRTSSPLAHFEISHDKARPGVTNNSDGGLADRRSSSSMYDPRLQRVPSLPPTREVEEEEGQDQPQTPAQHAFPPQLTSPLQRQAQLPHRPRQTPPPSSHLGPSPLSPPKRATSNYVPSTGLQDFAPPPRSQTQSPGALRNGKPVESIPRPSSVHDPAPPRSALYTAVAPPAVPNSAATSPVFSRSRGFSQSLSYVAPTDGRQDDPLQRWKGAPLISWGVGGTIVTTFPKDIPRYGVQSSAPMIVRSPGEVRVKNVKDIQPMEERLAKFPGPLKGKSKKKETVAWLTTGIESLERAVPTNLHAQQHASHDDKRASERILLWKILRLFVEHDGTLEGNPTVEKAVRDLLLPNTDSSGVPPAYLNSGGISGVGDLSTATTQSDAVDSSTVEQIRLHLSSGDSEKAVWTAVDKRLWGHALLIANALKPDLYKQVTQEFIKKEVNHPGQNNESLAALYEVLGGNHEECVDELVPVHARAGLQLVAKGPGSGSSKDALGNLDKWRETLGLILSNRSADDARAINSLGNLLSGYGRAEAAHICFLFARNHTVFGGLDDPASNFVLLGSDHKRQSEQFAKEIEPLLLSEVYEYGQSLAGGPIPVSNPHLAAYKLQHALALAEYGFRDKALQYCEAIATAITAQTKRSPYHHPILEAAVEDLMKRLKLAPKEESNSWIPKPSMNKVSDTMWNRFNKFVAGDDNDGSGQGSPKEESGPFARMGGGTPNISRPPSTSNLESFGATIPSAVPIYGMPNPPVNGPVPGATPSSAPPTRAGSRYAPAAGNPYDSNSAYAPRSSMERSSGEYNRSSLDLPRRSSEFQHGFSTSNKPSPSSSYAPQYGQNMGISQEAPYGAISPPQTSTPSFGYEPVSQPKPALNGTAAAPATEAPVQTPSTGGYQPYGYEPPSQSSYEPPSQSSYEPLSQNSYEPPAAESNNTSSEAPASGGFEPPSYQPYGYEPPSYEPDSQPVNDDDSDEDSKPKPKKKGIMYDDDDEDDFGAKKPAEKTKEERDRENAELFRKAAEEDAKRAAEARQAKKGWGFSGWFGGGKKESADSVAAPNKPVRAKLGEANSYYYDKDQGRWVNKNGGPDDGAAKKSAPPPPKSAPPPGARSVSSSPAPPMNSPPMAIPGGDAAASGRASAPPPSGPPRPMGMTPPVPSNFGNGSGLVPPAAPGMMRSVSNTSSASAPPSRPATGLRTSESVDDLYAPRDKKSGAKKIKKPKYLAPKFPE